MRTLTPCLHGWQCGVSDDAGVSCDAGAEACRALGALGLCGGEPVLSCRECDQDVCCGCAGAARLREWAAWTGFGAAHEAAWLGRAGAQARPERDAFGWTPLHWLAWRGAAAGATLAALCEGDAAGGVAASLGAADPCGQTPLMLACRCASASALEAALGVFERSASPERLEAALLATDWLGRNAVMLATISGDICKLRAVCRRLQPASAGSAACAADVNGFTALHAASHSGLAELVSELLRLPGVSADGATAEGFAPLRLAVEGDGSPEARVATVRALLAGGARADASSADIPLLLVVCSELAAAAAQVAAADAPPDEAPEAETAAMAAALAAAAADAEGAGVAPPQPLQPRATSSRTSSEGGIGDGGDSRSSSSSSSNSGSNSNNSNSNNSDNHNTECGREQAERERTAAREVALALVRAGAPVHCVDADSGLTPLHLAAKAAEPELVAALLAGGALADEPCSSAVGGYTPLHFCAQHWSEPSAARAEEVARALLAAGAKAEHATAEEKLTALHLAALFADVALCKVLVEEGGAAVTAKDADGDTALHNAAGRVSGRSGNRVPVCTYLLDQGAPLESVNRKGFTPLAVAAAAENRPEAALLVGRGAKAVTLTVTEDGEIRTADGAPLDAEVDDHHQQQRDADKDYRPRKPKKRRF